MKREQDDERGRSGSGGLAPDESQSQGIALDLPLVLDGTLWCLSSSKLEVVKCFEFWWSHPIAALV